MLYKVIALLILLIVAGHFFQLEEPVRQFFERIADIPSFEEKGANPALFDLAVRLAYLIAIIGALKLLLRRPSDDDG